MPVPSSPAPTRTGASGSDPVRGRLREGAGDDTATLGTATGRATVLGAVTRVLEVDGDGSGTSVDEVGPTVVVVRGREVELEVELTGVVDVEVGTHQAGIVVEVVVDVVVDGTDVVDNGVVLATVVLVDGVVVVVVHTVVVDVVGAAVVVVRGVVDEVVDEEVGAGPVVVLEGGAVVEVVVVVATEYEYDTQTVAEASMMIRLTWFPLPNPWVWPTAANDESKLPGPTNGAMSAPSRVSGGRFSLVSTGPVSKPDPA